MGTVIAVDNLVKEYRLGLINHATLRQDFVQAMNSFFGRSAVGGTGPSNGRGIFRALDGVSFTVDSGEVLGIIGANGAGKSTLLKILSRITAPTSGTARLRGRVASLLEVGTGFHPELTGRENIFLNGAILGLTRIEIARRFDEIVDFAEIAPFLDTPVKRYSSGMYVRLAFAVAAHLEPEILIVDEVLAVGDARFQNKCLGKMGEVGASGRTILFVSHNMVAVRNLCRRALWLADGSVRSDGVVDDVVDAYLRDAPVVESLEQLGKWIAGLPADPVFRLEEIDIRQDGESTTSLLSGCPTEITVGYRVFQRVSGLRVYFDLSDGEGTLLLRSFHDDDADQMSLLEPGHYLSKAVVPADLLAPRHYELKVVGTIYNQRCLTPGGITVRLHVTASGGINRAYPHEPVRARLQPRIAWSTEQR